MIGAGRVGTAVAVLLARAGHRIVAVSGRAGTATRAERFLQGVPVMDATPAAAAAELVVVAVPDDAIAGTVEELAPTLKPGQWVAHLSGAIASKSIDLSNSARITYHDRIADITTGNPLRLYRPEHSLECTATPTGAAPDSGC